MEMPKTLIFIIGPQAVGKMTVGHELSRMTGFKFMHNHQTIDLLLPIFDFGTPSFARLLFDFRLSIFEEVAASELPGFIFSCVSDFDSLLDRAHTECYSAPFLRCGGRVLFVELEASLATRLERNRSDHRQVHKVSKRDAEFAERLLQEERITAVTQMVIFLIPYPHLKIVNDALSPQEVAIRVCAHFKIGAIEKKP
jgi:hypothetical protein